MSAQNKVAAGGGSNRKNKKKRKGRSQQKEEDEKKVVDCASKASGLCTGCDDIHQDEVKVRTRATYCLLFLLSTTVSRSRR